MQILKIPGLATPSHDSMWYHVYAIKSNKLAEQIDFSLSYDKQDQGSKAPSRDHPNISIMTRLDYIRVED